MARKRERGEYFREYFSRPEVIEAEKRRQAARIAHPDYAEKERLRSIKRRAAERERINEWARIRHAVRMTADPAYRLAKAVNATRWIKRNPAKATANVMRRDAQKRRAVPAWADKEHIETFYLVAAAYKELGIAYQVDHIVPLRSKIVCGLHTEDNLQLLEPRLNKSKGNRTWPDHPYG